MKILWITNTIFPRPSRYFGFTEPFFGGWMYSLADQLSSQPNIKLIVATIYGGNVVKETIIDDVTYYLLPSNNNLNYDKNLEVVWQEICMKVNPDIVHIHGTEYLHGLACMRSLPNLKYVISIQGLISVITRYYFAGLALSEIITNITFRDIIRNDNIFQARNKFKVKGEFEKEYISRVKHVIGRTNWDKIHSKDINKNLKYHFCNESLRNSFYTANKWSKIDCVTNTIFLSQGAYPLKGLHQVIKAIIPLKIKYPDIQIRISGPNIIAKESLIDKIKFSGYGKIIFKLLKNNNLINNVVFLGMLNEEEIISEYQNANVFICPSSIENSPNSVGEAQLIGVPTIASYVGGIPDMIIDGFSGLLYRFEEIEILTNHIDTIFSNNMIANELSNNSKSVSSLRHDRESNLTMMLKIYNDIILG